MRQSTLLEEPPRGFVCPITQQVMKDPVTTIDGMAYERTAIETWLGSHSTSPATNLPLCCGRTECTQCPGCPAALKLVPQYALRSIIEEYMERLQQQQARQLAVLQSLSVGSSGADTHNVQSRRETRRDLSAMNPGEVNVNKVNVCPTVHVAEERWHYYGICYNGSTFTAIPNPQHNRYRGFVYGTLQRHPDTFSAIEEYRRHVKA